MLSTAMQVNYLNVEKPKEYSVKNVHTMADEMKYLPLTDDSGITPDNIIVIMNESWADLSVIGDFNTSSEISPFISRLNENTIKGNLFVPSFAGGTANTEYEFLTCNSLAFMPHNSYPYQNYVKPGDETLVTLMNDMDYNTVAFHPETETNWNRNKVYEYMGFDKFLSLKDFTGDYLRWYPSDQSVFEQIISLYEGKNPGEKLFTFNITMQNHGGFAYDDFENTVSLSDYPGKYPLAEQYLTLLKYTDKAFENLIDYF